jgi:circadian clock protein KaiC
MSEDDAPDEDWFESALQDDDSDATDDAGSLLGDDGPFEEATDGADGGTDDSSGGGDDGPFGESAEDAFGGDMFDDEGFGGFGDDDSGFDEDDHDSDIERIDIGVEGLDDMILGGVPVRHLIVAVGGAGTGKTTFGLQFLHHGLQHGEKAVFIALEQSRDAIVATANEWGWDFTQYEEQGTLVIVDLDPVEMANSLNNIRDELPQLIRDFGADRLVLDSVSLLEMMYDDQAKRRTEVFDFTRSLKNADVTTFLTSEASETNPYASRHGIIEYLTDAVFVLKFVRGETQETRLAIEIQKIRNANHSREMKPYELTDEGLSVYQNANIF